MSGIGGSIAKKIKSGGSPAKVVEDESDYDPENEGSDSFDADFDAAKESDHGDVDNFVHHSKLA